MIDKTPFSETTVSVTELNAQIKACMDSPIFKGLEVFGEISGCKLSGANAYFTLKDKFSQISCVCFSASKTYMPKDGESVLVRGSLDYYAKGGRLSLIINTIAPVGQGLLFLEFERLKNKLAQEGLFDEAHKKRVPVYVKRALIVTSKTGAVIRDIVTTIRRKNPVLDICVRDVRVQGEGAGREIAATLARVDKLGFDVIVLARGGGSLEDLAPFYDERLCRTIYAMQTPVVSAIGHETDYSLADFVADRRAPTPTAAGELIAYDYYALSSQIKTDCRRLGLLMRRLYERKLMRTRLASEKLRNRAASFYRDRARRIENCNTRMGSAVEKRVQLCEIRLKSAIDRLDNLSPLKILKRGYFKLSVNGESLTQVSKLAAGDKIAATGGDGSFTAVVENITLNEENKNND